MPEMVDVTRDRVMELIANYPPEMKTPEMIEFAMQMYLRGMEDAYDNFNNPDE